MSEKRITVKEVARLAEVSLATAYRVINGTAAVSPGLESRVRAAAERLGLRIRQRSRRKVIAFVLGNRPSLHPFHSHVLVGAAALCAERDYSVQFFPFNYEFNVPGRELVLPRVLRDGTSVDGFIVGGTNAENLLERLEQTRRPFAVLGNNVVGSWDPNRYDVVWMDLVATAGEMTRYLQGLGHKDIWFVGNCRLPWAAQCYEGYHRAMEEAGVDPKVSEFDSENDREAGYLATKSILNHNKAVTAIFAASDSVAHGVYEILRDYGLRVPDDVSVLGVGDRAEAVTLHPPLTTLLGFPEHVGRRLGELVLNRIERPNLSPQRVVIPTKMIKRDSCTRPSPALTYQATDDRRLPSIAADS